MGAVISSLRWLSYGMNRLPTVFWIDWVCNIGKLLKLQASASWFAIRSCSNPLEYIRFQYETHRLLWDIEVNHLMETSIDNRLGTEEGLSRALPHVDTSFSKSAGGPFWLFGLGAFFFQQPKKKMSQMMDAANSGPIAAEVVLVGGGHSHAFVIKNMGMRPEPNTRVTLITQSVETPYSGMLPGYVAGKYTREECHIDLGRLCRFGKVRLIIGSVYKVDRFRKLIYVESDKGERDRPPIRYDVMSIDIGSSPQMVHSVKDEEMLSPTPVKPISQFGAKWDKLVETIASLSKAKSTVKVGIVGAGAGGVELALSMHHRLKNILIERRQNPDVVQLCLFSKLDIICPSHSALVRKKLLRILNERGVEVIFNFEATAVESGRVISKDGRSVDLDECIWCTSATTQDWIRDSGFAVDDRFIRVKDTLESENTKNVFGAGDCANVINHPRAKAGVFAVRQGPPLTENLRRAARNVLSKKTVVPLLPFEPQTTFLGIIGTGESYCIASKGDMALEGEWLWDLKDWIDRKWMAGYSSQLPIMIDDDDDDDDDDDNSDKGSLEYLKKASLMRCGGCGAKVGKSVLDQSMAQIKDLVPQRSEVQVGLDMPDDCAVVSFQGSRVVQTVDFFRSFIDDPYVFGQVAANHALSDCFAMCSDPVSAMAIAVVPFAKNDVAQGDLTQMMAGACKALKQANCALVGGHSCEGSELALGFAVSGNTLEKSASGTDDLLTKGGCRKGDVLILTKPIGTGVLFAADMRVLAKGIWVDHALKSMLQSNQYPAKIAKQNGATSCTDVTGFGLIGHLVEMMQASSNDLVATLRLSKIPLLPGAIECVRAGVFSSLQPENLRIKRVVQDQSVSSTDEKYPLIYDPQTSGGLLLSIPAENAQQVLSKVPGSAIIGSIESSSSSSSSDSPFKVKVVQ